MPFGGRLTALTWLRGYSGGWLRADLIAGFTLAAYLLPAALGDASLAGLPPQAGLYACCFAGAVYWLCSGGRHTAITVTSALSLLVGSSLGPLAGGDPARFAALASATALLAGAIGLIAHAVRAGVLVEFISETVLIGFKCGIALVLVGTQLPKLLGLPAAHGGFFANMAHTCGSLGQASLPALAIGCAALLLILLGKRWLRHKPVALFVLVGGIAVSALLDLSSQGVKTLGVVPQGLPLPGLPLIHLDDINELLPLALACFLLAAVESAAIGRMFASRHGDGFDANQELLGLAVGNLAAGAGQGFPVGGGMSQSLVNDSGGARTPLSGLLAALILAVVALSCTWLLADLPQPVLAAIILTAVLGLVDVPALLRLWRFDRGEFAIAAAVIAVVLASGILRGVLIGVVVSLLLMLRRAARPRIAELGRVPGSDIFADHERHPKNRPESDAVVARIEGPLLFFNARHVHDRVLELAAHRPEAKLLIITLGMTASVDLAGCEMLGELHHALARRGVALRLADEHGGIRDVLRRAGFAERCHPVHQNQTIDAVLRQWRFDAQAPPAHSPVQP